MLVCAAAGIDEARRPAAMAEPVRAYLEQIGRYALLRPEQEVELARLVQRGTVQRTKPPRTRVASGGWLLQLYMRAP